MNQRQLHAVLAQIIAQNLYFPYLAIQLLQAEMQRLYPTLEAQNA